MWPDGAKYEGNWEKNKAVGKGVFKHANGICIKVNGKTTKLTGMVCLFILKPMLNIKVIGKII